MTAAAAATLELLEATPASGRVRIMTTSHAADLYLGELARQGRTQRTIASYRRTLHKLADAYPHHDVDELTATLLRRFLDGYQHNQKQRGQANRPATIAQAVTIVRCFFKWLHDEDLIQHNPADRIRRPKVAPAYENDNVVTVSSDDVKLILFAANRAGWQKRIAANLAVYSGARRHALAIARRGDYDPFARTLRFQEKGGKIIVKPVADPLADVLDAAIIAGVYESDDDYLIPGNAAQRRRGDRDDRVVWRLIKSVASDAGVKTTVHALRAAFAVFYLETKGDDHLFSLQQLMGHARVETTMVYLRRLDRRRSMETVRDLDWGSGTASDEKLDSYALAEKEGFEPSIQAKSSPGRDGIPSGVRSDEGGS
jgi:site-specific recombinase XerD